MTRLPYATEEVSIPWYRSSATQLGARLLQKLREFENVELCIAVKQNERGEFSWQDADAFTPVLLAWSNTRSRPFIGSCEVWEELLGGHPKASSDVISFLQFASWLAQGKPRWEPSVIGGFLLTLLPLRPEEYTSMPNAGMPQVGFTQKRAALQEGKPKFMSMADYMAALTECREWLDDGE